MQIQPLKKEDIKAIKPLAVKTMQLDCLVDKEYVNIYASQYCYTQLAKATDAFGAYIDNRLVGLLMVEEYGKPKVFDSWYLRFIITMLNWIMTWLYRKASDYLTTNKQFVKMFKKENYVSGEILYLAVNPEYKQRGIGTQLLKEFERLHQGKTIYLLTDSLCIYSFYEKRGFTKRNEQSMFMNVNGKSFPLTCYLFSKTFR